MSVVNVNKNYKILKMALRKSIQICLKSPVNTSMDKAPCRFIKLHLQNIYLAFPEKIPDYSSAKKLDSHCGTKSP